MKYCDTDYLQSIINYVNGTEQGSTTEPYIDLYQISTYGGAIPTPRKKITIVKSHSYCLCRSDWESSLTNAYITTILVDRVELSNPTKSEVSFIV